MGTRRLRRQFLSQSRSCEAAEFKMALRRQTFVTPCRPQSMGGSEGVMEALSTKAGLATLCGLNFRPKTRRFSGCEAISWGKKASAYLKFGRLSNTLCACPGRKGRKRQQER